MAKNKNKEIRVSEGSEDQPADNFQWETLKDLMQETVGAMVSQQELIRALMDKAKDIFISNNKESEYQTLMIPVLGFFNSYKDIADKLRKNSELHITYNDDNAIIDYKKGEVSEENDDAYNYLSIASNYVHAQEQIADLSYKTYSEIIATLQEHITPNMKNNISDIDLSKITSEWNELKTEIKDLYEKGV